MFFAVLPMTTASSHSQSICVRPLGRMIGSPVPVIARSAADFRTPPASGLRVTWLGHSTTLLEIEGLREIQPPRGAESTYRTADETEWARRWPMEQIWIVRKER